mmetsp:Transcript_2994/g.2582  ORF Transcript_2994/g.2582 Transcript_2994/m.2582 type:complete len:122 (-) Transcript_2994:950-1315(-)
MWGKIDITHKSIEKEQYLDYNFIRPKKLHNIGIPDKKHVTFAKISAGAYHCAAISEKGLLFTWGDDSQGCLGHREVKNRDNPTLVSEIEDKKIIDVSCGEKFTTCIVQDNKNSEYEVPKII